MVPLYGKEDKEMTINDDNTHAAKRLLVLPADMTSAKRQFTSLMSRDVSCSSIAQDSFKAENVAEEMCV